METDKEKEETVLEVLIEIPKGSRNKYEFDKKRRLIKLDRMLFSSVHYPSDYGYFPETLALDGDPLDALVLVGEPTFPGCLVDVKPIGLFKMRDEKGPDEKNSLRAYSRPDVELPGNAGRRTTAPVDRNRTLLYHL